MIFSNQWRRRGFNTLGLKIQNLDYLSFLDFHIPFYTVKYIWFQKCKKSIFFVHIILQKFPCDGYRCSDQTKHVQGTWLSIVYGKNPKPFSTPFLATLQNNVFLGLSHVCVAAASLRFFVLCARTYFCVQGLTVLQRRCGQNGFATTYHSNQGLTSTNCTRHTGTRRACTKHFN